MDRSSASSYIYARASGILVKSYIGEKSKKLFAAKSLSEIWELLFSAPVPQVPEVILANRIEYEAVKRFVSQYTLFLETYSNPDEYFIQLLRRYEIENLKVLSASISLNEEKRPRIVDIGKYKVLNYEKWPKLSQITENSVFEWYSDTKDITNRQKQDFLLDLQEIKILWQSINRLRGEGKSVLKEYFIKEYSVRNMLWALRLKVYYNFSRQKIIENLFHLSDVASKNDLICKRTFEILDKPIDDYDAWKTWRYASYLNKYEAGSVWKINPMIIEQHFRYRQTVLTKKMFHQYPMSAITLAMFFYMKQEELNVIRAATERLRLNADVKEALYVAGVKENETMEV